MRLAHKITSKSTIQAVSPLPVSLKIFTYFLLFHFFYYASMRLSFLIIIYPRKQQVSVIVSQSSCVIFLFYLRYRSLCALVVFQLYHCSRFIRVEPARYEAVSLTLPQTQQLRASPSCLLRLHIPMRLPYLVSIPSVPVHNSSDIRDARATSIRHPSPQT